METYVDFCAAGVLEAISEMTVATVSLILVSMAVGFALGFNWRDKNDKPESAWQPEMVEFSGSIIFNDVLENTKFTTIDGVGAVLDYLQEKYAGKTIKIKPPINTGKDHE